jgi:hypothetical protein
VTENETARPAVEVSQLRRTDRRTVAGPTAAATAGER